MNGRERSLLVVTPWFPPTREGWPYPFIGQSCIALAKRGWIVKALVVRTWKPSWLAQRPGSRVEAPIDTEAFPELGEIETMHTYSLPRQRLAPLSNRILDARARRRLAQGPLSIEGADAVLVHTEGLAPAIVPLCRQARKPVAVVVHGVNTSRAFMEAPRQKARLKGALAAASRVVLVGEPLRAHFSRYVGRDDHFRVVANGVVVPEAPPVSILDDGRPLRLVSVANLQEGKGIDIALRAMARLLSEGMCDWRYQLVGEGPERAALERLVDELALRSQVTFAGALQNAQVMRLLAQSDVFVLPSYREAFGIAYLEAMATGLIAIGVEGEGPSQFIRHGETGLLVAPRSVEAVADAIRPMLGGERAPYRAMAAAGAMEARRDWSWERHAEALERVLEESMREPCGENGR